MSGFEQILSSASWETAHTQQGKDGRHNMSTRAHTLLAVIKKSFPLFVFFKDQYFHYKKSKIQYFPSVFSCIFY